MPTIPIYIYLPAYYATEVGLGLTAVGGVLLAARIFDTVLDPVCGYLSDRLHWRFGRRKPLMLGGGVVAAGAMLALAHPPDSAGSAYLLGFSVLLYAGWTFVIVPYTAWGAELADDYDTRSKITAAREGAMLIGILLAAGIPLLTGGGTPPGPATAADGDGSALRSIAWAAVLVGVPGFLLIALKVPDAPRRRTGRVWTFAASAIRQSLFSIFGNKPFLRLFGAWFVNGLANGFPAVLFILYMEHGLNISDGDKPAFILGYFLPGVLFVPLWVWLCQRSDKHRIWCLAMLLASAAFAIVPFLDPEQSWLFLLVCVVTGATLGADLALPPSMQADVVDHDRLQTGKDRTGIYFALWGMATKLALAFAVGIAFPVLELAGFDPEAAMPDAIWALVAIYAIVPIALKISAVAIVAGFPIGRRQHERIRRELAALEEHRGIST